jgi:hypothetical protein
MYVAIWIILAVLVVVVFAEAGSRPDPTLGFRASRSGTSRAAERDFGVVVRSPHTQRSPGAWTSTRPGLSPARRRVSENST